MPPSEKESKKGKEGVASPENVPFHLEYIITEEDGYYEDLYPGPVHGNYADDFLDVVVDNASDEETSEVSAVQNIGHILIFWIFNVSP